MVISIIDISPFSYYLAIYWFFGILPEIFTPQALLPIRLGLMNNLLPYQIILADDHLLVRQGIRRLIEEYEDYRVVAEVGSCLELFQAMRNHQVDLVILDFTLPDFNGIEAAKKIKETYPGMKILILSFYENQQIIDRVIAAGADAYVLKDKAAEKLFESIKMVL
jgi:DNA-binding NarL/FixJ family response regulator